MLTFDIYWTFTLQSMCIDDEFKVAHRVYSLDYRPIEGDVTEEGNSFIAPNFKPHGMCF